MKPETEAEIVEMHEGGLTLKSIADEMGISSTAVRNILKKYGKETSRVVVDYDEEDIIQQYVSNEPVPQILEDNNISYAQLYTILRNHKVPTRKAIRQDVKQERLAQAVELYQDGVPLWNIKEETGIHQPTLHAELHRRHIPLRRQLTRPFDSSVQEVNDGD